MVTFHFPEDQSIFRMNDRSSESDDAGLLSPARAALLPVARKVHVRLPGKVKLNSHGARPVHLLNSHGARPVHLDDQVDSDQ